MQLTIFLGLMHTRGVSLPDKRTALYDNYVETLFNRESEKSETVLINRDLLIDIHRYLAWVLHSKAESKAKEAAGSIKTSQLRSLVKAYLKRESPDTTLVDVLFTDLIERVVALVSRVQGTYEFEVQPLREYFAARYLYDTAVYSPAGGERSGTLPDRFLALAGRFYWLNVVRFYAGCYSKGELPSLADGLRELVESRAYAYTSHPQMLALHLLAG